MNMINPTQMHRLPCGLDQQGRYETRDQAVRLALTAEEQGKLTRAASWFKFAGYAANDEAKTTEGMGFEAADVLRRADVREALDDIRFGDDLTDAACWLAAGIMIIGVVSFALGVLW